MLESIALGFREAYGDLSRALVAPVEVIATGVPAPTISQLAANDGGFDGPSRGRLDRIAARRSRRSPVGSRQTGAIQYLSALPASTGATFDPCPDREAAYDRLLGEQRALYAKLIG